MRRERDYGASRFPKEFLKAARGEARDHTRNQTIKKEDEEGAAEKETQNPASYVPRRRTHKTQETRWSGEPFFKNLRTPIPVSPSGSNPISLSTSQEVNQPVSKEAGRSFSHFVRQPSRSQSSSQSFMLAS